MRVFLCIGAAAVFGACGGGGESSLPVSTALSPEGMRQQAPSYSRDGKRISYWTPASGGWQLWVANADLSAPRKLPVVSGAAIAVTPTLWSPDGSTLATISSDFGLAHAVVVPVAGGDPRRVAAGTGVDFPVGWFADGVRLAYIALSGSGGGTFVGRVVSLKTGESTPLVPAEKHPYVCVPALSGARIACEVNDGSRSTIWVADSAGGTPRALTSDGFETSPEWSPNGREILYESRRTGTSDLWVIPVDGGSPRQLTRDVRNDYGGVWSPDGKWVAFLSDRGRQIDVWIVPAAGGEEHRVTDTPEVESNLAWRPGTDELTYAVSSRSSGIWALDLATGVERRLTPDSIRTSGFWGSPDGKQFDYIVDRGGGVQELAVMPDAGGSSRTLVSGGDSVVSGSWSPDGSRIVYTSDRGGRQHIWVVDAAGGAPRQLTTWPSADNSPAWSGDGSAIYFVSDHDSRLGDIWKVPVAGGEPTRVTTSGGVSSVSSRPGVADLFAGSLGSHGGQLGIVRVGPDGREAPVWDRANAFPLAISPRGDSLAAWVEQPNGKMQPMILSAKSGSGRLILSPDDLVSFWSNDGKSIVYQMDVNGVRDIGILNVADGTTRRLTTTPEDEGGAELTPDGKTVLFNRTKRVERLFTANLSRIVGRAK